MEYIVSHENFKISVGFGDFVPTFQPDQVKKTLLIDIIVKQSG